LQFSLQAASSETFGYTLVQENEYRSKQGREERNERRTGIRKEGRKEGRTRTKKER
jgi:hypothetical protein